MLPGGIVVIVDVGFVKTEGGQSIVETTAEMSQWPCHCAGGSFEEISSIQ